MKRNASAVAALALLAAACGKENVTPITVDEARSAIPSSSQAQIPAPQNSATSEGPGATALSLPASSPAIMSNGPAPYALATVALSASVNGSVAFALGLVDFLVQFPPTTCAGETCTWGPGYGALDVNEFQLTVTKVAEGDFRWKFQGRKRGSSDAFTSIIFGEAFPSGTRHVGHGTLTVDMDAAQTRLNRIGQPDDQGQLLAEYDNRSAHALDARFLGTRDSDHPEQTVDAAYAFEATSAGGDLQVATRNRDSGAGLTLHSRWTATGAGRGDAVFTQGSVTIARSECWDAAATLFDLLYRETSPDLDSSNFGDVASCGAFATAVTPFITAPPAP